MKVRLRVTNLANGKVKNVTIEAASEAEALAKYDAASGLSAEIAPPNRDRAIAIGFVAALVLGASTIAIANGIPYQMVVLFCVFIYLVFFVLFMMYKAVAG